MTRICGNNSVTKSNQDVRGEMANVYYLTNDHLVRLEAYSERLLNWFTEDEHAVGSGEHDEI